MAKLTPFEGKEVTEVGVEIRNVAGGLQDAMKFDPVEWRQGDEHYIVLRCVVKEIDHEPVVKDDYAGDQRRVHVLTATEATPIAAKFVEEQMQEQRDRIKKLKDEVEGTPSLLDGDGDLPLGDEDLEAKEIEALISEGHSEEDARRIAAEAEPVNA